MEAEHTIGEKQRAYLAAGRVLAQQRRLHWQMTRLTTNRPHMPLRRHQQRSHWTADHPIGHHNTTQMEAEHTIGDKQRAYLAAGHPIGHHNTTQMEAEHPIGNTQRAYLAAGMDRLCPELVLS